MSEWWESHGQFDRLGVSQLPAACRSASEGSDMGWGCWIPELRAFKPPVLCLAVLHFTLVIRVVSLSIPAAALREFYILYFPISIGLMQANSILESNLGMFAMKKLVGSKLPRLSEVFDLIYAQCSPASVCDQGVKDTHLQAPFFPKSTPTIRRLWRRRCRPRSQPPKCVNTWGPDQALQCPLQYNGL